MIIITAYGVDNIMSPLGGGDIGQTAASQGRQKQPARGGVPCQGCQPGG
jgi:hypothetical protein